jgi:hypothetical protein
MKRCRSTTTGKRCASASRTAAGKEAKQHTAGCWIDPICIDGAHFVRSKSCQTLSKHRGIPLNEAYHVCGPHERDEEIAKVHINSLETARVLPNKASLAVSGQDRMSPTASRKGGRSSTPNSRRPKPEAYERVAHSQRFASGSDEGAGGREVPRPNILPFYAKDVERCGA